MQREMHWSALLVLCTILLTVVIANPINKHSLQHKKAKHTVLHKKSQSKTAVIKSKTDALKFFTQFGFNRCENPPGSKPNGHNSSVCRPSMESMLEAFQITFHLPVTKKLDAATLKLMNRPRCNLYKSPQLFVVKSKLWPTNRTLKWKFDHGDSSYGSLKTRQDIQQAFDDWTSLTELTFREATGHEKADFNLTFVDGNHGDAYPFDGRDGVLAHAFFPWDSESGQIHFDSTENWSSTYDGVGYNLRLVATHEIGHSLGLSHTYDSNSIMYLFYHLIQPQDMLPEQDHVAIQELYGNKLHPVTNSSTHKSVETTITIQRTTTPTTKIVPLRGSWVDIHPNTKWNKNGQTVGGQNPSLLDPQGLFVDDDQTVYVADGSNHCIVAWKEDETKGQVVAGGQGKGEGAHQLTSPTDVIVDKETDSLIICDRGNNRVVRWPRRNGTSAETIISGIACWGLTMDEDGSLYVTDTNKNQVRRYGMDESQGTIVAGWNGKGNRLDQLNWPAYIFVDQDHSVFVSDNHNHRVMKWIEGAKKGIVVAGGQGSGLSQLYYPQGILVDQLGTVYVVDGKNHRVVRWPKGAKQGNVIVGGNGGGAQANQLSWPDSISFDRNGDLYLVDWDNKRVQRFTIEIPSN